jgi:hypothetical protein
MMDETTYQAILALFQMGGQYLIPAAVLLRALYAGMRGKMPEGLTEIFAASFLTGVTAVVAGEDLNLREVFGELISNTVFMAGLLSFIVVYLLRQPNRGQLVDGIVGGILGIIVWIGWSLILGNDWPWWIVPLVMIGGAASFIALRMLLVQLGRLVRIATWLIRIGFIFLIGAGIVLAFQAVTGWFATSPLG